MVEGRLDRPLSYDGAFTRTRRVRTTGEQALLPDETVVDSFSDWVRESEPRIRQALTASFGPQVGTDAATDALSYAWEHWDRIRLKSNPLGFVFGVGRNKARRMVSHRTIVLPDVPGQQLPHVEPGLPAAIAHLPERQRIVVSLLYGYEWTMSEVGDLLGIGKTTVQKHSERGLAKLRTTLGVEL